LVNRVDELPVFVAVGARPFESGAALPGELAADPLRWLLDAAVPVGESRR
jgi:hypothetical protein